MFEEEIKNKITKFFKNIENLPSSSNENIEIEFKFFYQNVMSYSIYNKLLDFYNAMNTTHHFKIIKETSLDILYGEFRFSIIGLSELNDVLNKNTYKQNNLLLKYVIDKILEEQSQENYIAIKKIKKEYVDINDYNILFKKANEVTLSNDELQKIKNDIINNNNISFRYKDRIKLIIENNDNYSIQLDLTNVRTLSNYMEIMSNYNKKQKYELELDVTTKHSQDKKNIKINGIKIYDIMIKWIEIIIKFI
jgi:hypothetical protein